MRSARDGYHGRAHLIRLRAFYETCDLEEPVCPHSP